MLIEWISESTNDHICELHVRDGENTSHDAVIWIFVTFQESFLRMQANAPTEDLLVHGQENVPQFMELSSR